MVTLLAAALAVALHPAVRPCDPAALFARVRTAIGGDRWKSVAEYVATGNVRDSGLSGTTHFVVDLHDGRSALRDDLDFEKTTVVYDGRTVWRMDSTLGVHPLDAPDARAAAASDAYLRRSGFFSSQTDPATFECLGTQRESARSFDVVRVTPRGGRPVSIWIDRATWLIDRTKQQAPTAIMTTTYSDYRSVGRLALPFEIAAGDGTPGGTTTRRFTHYRLRTAPNASDFQRPVAPTNQRMLGGATSTTVPFRIEDDEAVVEATIDGRGPFPFILDTGGHAILTTQAARALGLQGHGSGQSGGGGEGTIGLQFTRARTLRIGSAELERIPFLVIPYGPDFYDRGPGKPPLAGILGLEFFERFVVRFDYGRRLLTLTPLATFRYAGDGARLPISFQDDIPLTRAAADGHDGLFEVDTGNGGSTILIGDFLKHHGLFERYRNGYAGASFGTGGIVHNTTYRLRRLTVDGYDLNDFVVNFVVQQKGTFSSHTEAGNFGYDVLSQFTPTFDYRTESLYLERRPDAPLPAFNRVGVSVAARADRTLAVVRVISPSPAGDAGIVAGDRILSVDGVPSAKVAPLDFRRLTHQPVGTRMLLEIERRGVARTVSLRLRELFCSSGRPCGPSVARVRR